MKWNVFSSMVSETSLKTKGGEGKNCRLWRLRHHCLLWGLWYFPSVVHRVEGPPGLPDPAQQCHCCPGAARHGAESAPVIPVGVHPEWPQAPISLQTLGNRSVHLKDFKARKPPLSNQKYLWLMGSAWGLSPDTVAAQRLATGSGSSSGWKPVAWGAGWCLIEGGGHGLAANFPKNWFVGQGIPEGGWCRARSC